VRGLCPGLPPLDLLVVPAENLVHRVLVCADLVALVEEEDVALGVLRMRIHHKVTKIREDAQRCDAHRLVGAKMRCKQTCWRKDAMQADLLAQRCDASRLVGAKMQADLLSACPAI
jgi:hypothetical protein